MVPTSSHTASKYKTMKNKIINIAVLLVMAAVIFYVSSTKTEWKRVYSNHLGVSFLSPVEIHEPAIKNGVNSASGKSVQFVIPLPSGLQIAVRAETKDYDDGKDGFDTGAEGFVINEGKYYLIQNGMVQSEPYTPDEVIQLQDGSPVLIRYGKEYVATDDYPEAAVSANVTLLNKDFSGMGFILYNIDENGPHPASRKDINDFKKVVSSIEFIEAIEKPEVASQK